MNTFGRYSLGEVPPRRADALGIAAAVRRWSASPASRSRATRASPTASTRAVVRLAAGRLPLRLVPVQGRRAAVRLRHDAGGRRRHPQPEQRHDLHQRPALALHARQPGRHELGLGLGVNGCNCPLAQNEKQWQVVGNVTKIWGNHTIKVGIDVRRAYNLRVPSDQHRSGELTFNALRTSNAGVAAASAWPRSCSVTSRTARRGVRPLRQHQHRSARAAVAALLLRAGHLARHAEADAELRPAPRHHQPADGQRGRQRHLGRSVDRARPGRRRRRHRSRRQRREPPELGAAPRRDLSAEREDGDPRRLRPQLRHRRVRLAVRPHRHPEPAGAGRAEHDRPDQFASVFNLADGPPAPSTVAAGADGTFAWPNGVKPLRRAAQAASARGGRLERHGAASVERHGLGRSRPTSATTAATCSPATTPTRT